MELFQVVVRRRSCVATTRITSCPVLVVISLSNVFESERGEVPSRRIGPRGILATYLPSRGIDLRSAACPTDLRPPALVSQELFLPERHPFSSLEYHFRICHCSWTIISKSPFCHKISTIQTANHELEFCQSSVPRSDGR
jgi:hypothetical protein